MVLVVNTGMPSEQQVAKRYCAKSVVVLTGIQSLEEMEKLVPKECDAILSFGLCGGLAPETQIGQAFICDTLITPLYQKSYKADVAWRKRLFTATRYYERHWYSTNEFNTANSVEQRKNLFNKTGCWIIDDETWLVAEFASRHNIPFQALRVVSDGAEDNLPPAVINALNPDRSINKREIILSILTNPLQIPDLIKTAINYWKSLDELATAATAVGRYFQYELDKL